VKHKLTDGFHPRQSRTVLDWAEPGSIAVCFQNGERTCVTCIGGYWYECAIGEVPWWTMTTGRPELSYAYRGSTVKLRDHVTAMLAGKEVVITALKDRLFTRLPGKGIVERKPDQWDAYEAVGARRLMRGKGWPVCRIKASLKMPNTIHELIRDSDLIVGDGPASPDDAPALVNALQHEDARIRMEAAEDLGLIGPAASATVPALLKLAEKDADPVIRVEAAKAVASIDPQNKAAIPMLVEALKHKSAKVRKQAAECLGDLGPGAKSAIAALVQAISDSDPTVSWAAIDALGQIGPGAESAVPALVEALKDASTRGAAVDALGQIGRKAQAASPALEKVLKGEDVSVRWAAASALVRIGGPGVKTGVQYLLETATRVRERNWTDATHIFIAPTGRQALPQLIDAVRNPTLRDFATEMAGEASVYLTKDPLADVKVFLQDEDASVRCVAAWVLHCARAVEVKDVIAIQRETLKATDPWARRQAARFLGRLGPYGKDAAPALSAALEDKDEGVREAAAAALKSVQRK
jgi:HEAT repeat protein